MVIILIDKEQASISNLTWQSSSKQLLRMVRIFKDFLIIGYTPWPDYTLAQMAVKALGGKIIKATDPPEYVAGRVY